MGGPGRAGRPGIADRIGILLEAPIAFDADEIVVADLTGVAVQDAEIAKVVWRGLQRAPSSGT